MPNELNAASKLWHRELTTFTARNWKAGYKPLNDEWAESGRPALPLDKLDGGQSGRSSRRIHCHVLETRKLPTGHSLVQATTDNVFDAVMT